MTMTPVPTFRLFAVAAVLHAATAFVIPGSSPSVSTVLRAEYMDSLRDQDYRVYPNEGVAPQGGYYRPTGDELYYNNNNYRQHGYRRGAVGNGPIRPLQDLWASTTKPMTVQGGSLKTWSFSNPGMDQVQILMKTEGRPLDAQVEVWQGPGHTPQSLRVYMDDGGSRTFALGVMTPQRNYGSATISIRNKGVMEFPLEAAAEPDFGQGISAGLSQVQRYPEQLMGGSTRTYPLEPDVDSVAVLMETDGRPLNARVELLNGPTNQAQVMDMYSEDGLEMPVYVVVDTPGAQNSIRLINSGAMEFPITVCVAPYTVGGYHRNNMYSNSGSSVGRWM